MVTSDELAKVLLAPLLVAGVIGALGRWRRWAWAMPLAAGAGFLAGFGLLGVPRYPPLDGTDWLFWLAIPLTVTAVGAALIDRWWTSFGGIAAVAVVLVIVRPLTPHAVTTGAMAAAAIGLGVAAVAVCVVLAFADERIGSIGTIGALAIATTGAAVVAMSSNVRIVGLHGLAAAAALAPVALLSTKLRAGRAVAVLAVPLMAGLLTGAHFYANDGLAWRPLLLILGSPALAAVGLLIPTPRRWPRAAAALVAVSILVGAVAAPIALKAKRDAGKLIDPSDPASYYQ